MVGRARHPQTASSAGAAGFRLRFLMGVVFVAVQWLEWHSKTYGIGTSSYASLYFVTTGFHMAHVSWGLRCSLALSLGRPLITSARGADWSCRRACSTGISWTRCGYSCSQRITSHPI